MNKIIVFYLIIFLPCMAFSQSMVPHTNYLPPVVDQTDHVWTESELIDLLDTNYSPELLNIQSSYKKGDKTAALEKLASYFKEKFSQRFFFDWKSFDSKFQEYKRIYPNMAKVHENNALSFINRYGVDTKWKRPFKTLLGEEVDPNLVRRLVQQPLAPDVALTYYYTKDEKYLNLIPNLAKSMNQAYDKGLVESIKDGNGAYEEHRGGDRMLHWLFAHQFLLASENYTWQQQIEMIRTFLHTGSVFYQNNTKYQEGNHQTKGVSALAMIAMLFPEIKGTDKWQERSLDRLEEHLTKEVYADGFQFERTTHYHVGDIMNYFYPYQIAQINKITLRPIWQNKIEAMFDVMVKIAMPDKNAPALQDGDGKLGFMKIGETMALGATLFSNPEYNYFASKQVSATDYWLFKQDPIAKLNSIKKEAPKMLSVALPETGYYVMRQGWKSDNLYLIINAGITPAKPDHLQGDMLGLIGYAYGNMILPTYNVGYSDKDFIEFKNSWTKNVVQVDSITHGKGWIPNVGKTGFGSWAKIPVPKVLGYSSKTNFEYFVGSHDGYNDIGVQTFRSVFFIKEGFWIIKDQLIAEKGKQHTVQQIWQGNYNVNNKNKHLRSTFENGAGLDIVQFGDTPDNISKSSIQDKGRSIFEKRFENHTDLVTLLYPFQNSSEQIKNYRASKLLIKGFEVYANGNLPEGVKTDANTIIKKGNKFLFIGTTGIVINNKDILTRSPKTDLWLELNESDYSVTNCGIKPINIIGKKTVVVSNGETATIPF